MCLFLGDGLIALITWDNRLITGPCEAEFELDDRYTSLQQSIPRKHRRPLFDTNPTNREQFLTH